MARESGRVPFDIDGRDRSRRRALLVPTRCSNCSVLKAEPSLAQLALIVRGADTARPDIAAEAAGLHARCRSGLSALSR